jgi:mannose-6-phosphate isomerase-like protein (cupin superfamily)
MQHRSINLLQKFAALHETWMPRVIAEMNDYQFKLVRLQGEFIWHDHRDTDETFMVLEGILKIELPDAVVSVAAGEMYVVPKGVRHKPSATEEVKLLLIEPRGVLNTGDTAGARTAPNDVWI